MFLLHVFLRLDRDKMFFFQLTLNHEEKIKKLTSKYFQFYPPEMDQIIAAFFSINCFGFFMKPFVDMIINVTFLQLGVLATFWSCNFFQRKMDKKIVPTRPPLAFTVNVGFSFFNGNVDFLKIFFTEKPKTSVGFPKIFRTLRTLLLFYFN